MWPQPLPLGCPSAQAVEQYCLPAFSMASVRLTAHRQEGQAHFVWVAVVILLFPACFGILIYEHIFRNKSRGCKISNLKSIDRTKMNPQCYTCAVVNRGSTDAEATAFVKVCVRTSHCWCYLVMEQLKRCQQRVVKNRLDGYRIDGFPSCKFDSCKHFLLMSESFEMLI